MSGTTPEKLLLRVREAAELLGVSRSHLYELIQAGRVPVVRLGASVRVPRVWLERLVAAEIEQWERARADL